MKKHCLLAVFSFATCLQAMSQDQLKPDSLQELYNKKKKTAKTLIISGSIGLGASIAMGVVAMAQVTEDVLVPIATLQGDIDENAGEGAAIASTVFFIGGAALLTAGLITNGKANKMQREGLVYLKPQAPPVALPGKNLPQQGFGIGVRLGRR
jgi:transketolase N-terminal domain/subunit